MGLSHKLYTTNRSYSLEKVVDIIKKIRREAIADEKAVYYYQFRLNDVFQYQSIADKYPINKSVDWISIRTETKNAQSVSDLLKHESFYSQYSFYSHGHHDPQKPTYRAYRIFSQVEKRSVSVAVTLPQRSDQAKKSRIGVIIDAFVRAGILTGTVAEMKSAIERVVPKIKKGKPKKGKKWTSTDGLSMEAGSSSVRFHFSETFLTNKSYGVSSLSIALHECLLKITSGTISYKGTYYVTTLEPFLAALKQDDSFTSSTLVSVGLERMEDYQIDDLLSLPGVRTGDEEIVISDFKWRWSSPDAYGSDITLYINEDNSYEFELSIDMREADAMVPKLEERIKEKLHFVDYS